MSELQKFNLQSKNDAIFRILLFNTFKIMLFHVKWIHIYTITSKIQMIPKKKGYTSSD